MSFDYRSYTDSFPCIINSDVNLISAMSKGNPTPVQTEAFKASCFKRGDDTTDPLSGKLTVVRLTEPIFQIIQTLPNKSAFLRRVITEAVHRELMGDIPVAIADKPTSKRKKKGDVNAE